MYKKFAVLFFFSLVTIVLKAQNSSTDSDTAKFDFSTPKEYEIGGIFVTGSDHLDQNVLTLYFYKYGSYAQRF